MPDSVSPIPIAVWYAGNEEPGLAELLREATCHLPHRQSLPGAWLSQLEQLLGPCDRPAVLVSESAVALLFFEAEVQKALGYEGALVLFALDCFVLSIKRALVGHTFLSGRRLPDLEAAVCERCDRARKSTMPDHRPLARR